jgi:hypothetical protein
MRNMTDRGCGAQATACNWIVRLNDFEQRLPRHDGIHLMEKPLALGCFLLGIVLGIAEADFSMMRASCYQ